MKKLLRNLSRMALSRGMAGGSRFWLRIGVAAAVFRFLGKYIGDEPTVVYCEDLEPGQSMTIRHFPRVPK